VELAASYGLLDIVVDALHVVAVLREKFPHHLPLPSSSNADILLSLTQAAQPRSDLLRENRIRPTQNPRKALSRQKRKHEKHKGNENVFIDSAFSHAEGEESSSSAEDDDSADRSYPK
jgi:hypothetical protein